MRGTTTEAFAEMQRPSQLRPDIVPAAAARQLAALMDGLQVQWLLDNESVDMPFVGVTPSLEGAKYGPRLNGTAVQRVAGKRTTPADQGPRVSRPAAFPPSLLAMKRMAEPRSCPKTVHLPSAAAVPSGSRTSTSRADAERFPAKRASPEDDTTG
ncbi:hypothetical protein GU243_03945 [Pseudarthrobacter psychrotolerans]|uniref:BetI-type transcriptional repressor C-terminal domain-containing protein n=1 Tax=Pseudarthrobacter psychrotolerans TaxID=2697569 RepID=A0A6P1NIX1_9MICC|nr:hypothetical protein GU243_03945 [Pseudarthrobacter psychrotolerans]